MRNIIFTTALFSTSMIASVAVANCYGDVCEMDIGNQFATSFAIDSGVAASTSIGSPSIGTSGVYGGPSLDYIHNSNMCDSDCLQSETIAEQTVRNIVATVPAAIVNSAIAQATAESRSVAVAEIQVGNELTSSYNRPEVQLRSETVCSGLDRCATYTYLADNTEEEEGGFPWLLTLAGLIGFLMVIGPKDNKAETKDVPEKKKKVKAVVTKTLQSASKMQEKLRACAYCGATAPHPSMPTSCGCGNKSFFGHKQTT